MATTQGCEPGSLKWTEHHLLKIRNPKNKQCARYETVNSKNGELLSNICGTMVLPLPLGDDGVFSKDAVGFDDFAVSEMTSMAEFTSEILKKIWLMTLISLEQKNAGTPALCKSFFLRKKRWTDYDKWLYPGKSRSFNGMNKEAFISNSIHGSTVYDKDVAQHYKFLRDRTRHLPCTPILKPGQAPFVPDVPDPIPPAPEGANEVVGRFKYHVVLQPCRSKSNPDELAGFLFWVFVEDCNFNLDASRCNYINALKTHKREIQSKKGGFSKGCPLSQDIMNPINEMRADDQSMLSITHRDWNQWCGMYNLAVKTCQIDEEDEEDEEYEDEDAVMAEPRAEEEEEGDVDMAAKRLENYRDELDEPSSESNCSFFTTFTAEKAFLLAARYDMDAVHAAACIFHSPDQNGADLASVWLKPAASTEPTVEPSVVSTKHLHPFDNIYYMTQDYFYWSNSLTGTGLKYNTFPWGNNDSNPIYKSVVLKLPKKYAHKFVEDRSSMNAARLKRSRELSNAESGAASSSSRSEANDGVSSSSSATELEKRKRRRQNRLTREKTYIPTDSIQQMASAKGLNPKHINIGGCKIFEDPEAPSSDGNDYVAFKFSKTAEKDDVHKVIEIHRNWKSSIHRYSEVAAMDSAKPEERENMEGWLKERKAIVLGDYIVYEQSAFVQQYNAAMEAFEKSACESLFRVFKKGGQSIMTVAVNLLVINYFETIHNNVDDLSIKLYCSQTDFEESLFASYLKKMSLDLRYVCEIISNFKEFHVIYFGVLDVYRIGDDTHFNYIGSGEGGVGKSFLLALLKLLLVVETVVMYYMKSGKSDFTDLSKSDNIIAADEMPPDMAGYQAGNNDRHGHTMDSSVNATKTAMSTGISVYEVFEFLEFGDGDTGRITRKIETPCVNCRIIVTNNQVILDKALRDRCHRASFVNHVATNDDDDRDPLGDLHPTDMYEELTVLDMKTQIKSTDDSLLKRTQLGYSVFQTLHMIAEKMIGVGALPQVDVTLGNLIFNKVSKYIKARTNVSVAMRSHGRIANQMRTMIITDGLNQLFFSCCKDRDVINEKTLLCLKPYIFCQVHHAVFALTLLMDQIFDPYFNCVLVAAIGECGNFPVTQWVKRRAENRKIDRVALATTGNSTRSTNTAVAATVAIASDSTQNNDNAMEVEPANSERERPPVPLPSAPLPPPPTVPARHLEPELLCDILKEYYIQDVLNNDGSTILWRTVAPEKRVAGNNGTEQERLINLNYVCLTTQELGMINSLIADQMSPRLGNSDVGALLALMKETRIKVSGAPKPVSDRELMSPNSVGKLPCYEDKHTFTVLEQGVSGAGGKSHEWYFCMHILTDLNNGESLIMEALRTISYANLRPRPSLLTGFVESYQGATLRSESIMPDAEVPCFTAKNASYRDEKTRKKLAFNDTLLSHQQGNPISLKETIRLQDQTYKNREIKIYKDLDDWAAEEWFKKNGIPVVWVRKIRDADFKISGGSRTVNTKRDDFELGELELKWQFLRFDGKVELRELPTEYAQRVRNLYWIKKDAISGVRQTTEEDFPSGVQEWSDLDKDFKVRLFQREL